MHLQGDFRPSLGHGLVRVYLAEVQTANRLTPKLTFLASAV
jgi:hypothetical protein